MTTLTIDAGRVQECHRCDRTDIKARGLCRLCYDRHYRAGTLDEFPLPDRELV